MNLNVSGVTATGSLPQSVIHDSPSHFNIPGVSQVGADLSVTGKTWWTSSNISGCFSSPVLSDVFVISFLLYSCSTSKVGKEGDVKAKQDSRDVGGEVEGAGNKGLDSLDIF